jgi:hypothetical protein
MLILYDQTLDLGVIVIDGVYSGGAGRRTEDVSEGGK